MSVGPATESPSSKPLVRGGDAEMELNAVAEIDMEEALSQRHCEL